MSPLRPGDPVQLGHYQLLARLGEGGMGAVYLGRDPQGRSAAIKVIRPDLSHDPEFRRRFRREVDRARQVPPFCTAEVIDADPEHGTPYLVVEYVDGPSLAEVVQEKGPLSTGALHGVAVGVATALAAIHGAGVVHRDLKPANVLFGLGTPKVIDFGIARALDASSELTRPDQMVGTIGYMAPERFDARPGQQVGPPADVFAWGVVVAYAATGRTPFGGDTPMATVGRILTQPPDLIGLTGPLLDLVDAALSKEPGDRPTAFQLLDSLLAAQGDMVGELSRRPELRKAAVAARDTGRRVAQRRRDKRALVAAVALVLLGGAAGAVVHFDGVARSQESAAHRQAKLLAVQTLIAQSSSVRDTDPGLALRTAMAAQRINPGPTSRAAVTAALATRFGGEIGTTNPTFRAAYRPDGKVIATAGANGSLDLWNVSTDGASTRAVSLPVGNGPIRDVAFSSDGTMLASIGRDVRLWDVHQIAAPRHVDIHSLRESYDLALPVRQSVRFTPDGTGLFVENGVAISMWRLRDMRVAQPLWKLTKPNYDSTAPTAVDFTRRILVSLVYGRHVVVWRLHDWEKPSVLTTLSDIGDFSNVALSPNGKLMAIAFHGQPTGIYGMSDPARPKRIGLLSPAAGRIVGEIAFDRTGTHIAMGEADESENDYSVGLWDIRTPMRPVRLQSMRGHGGPVGSAEFSPDGARLLTASAGLRHTTMLWRVDTPLQARRGVSLQPQADITSAPAVSFSEDTVVAFSNGVLTTWTTSDPVRPRSTRKRLAPPNTEAIKVRTGPGGRMAFALGAVWDISDKDHPRPVLGHRSLPPGPRPPRDRGGPGVDALDMDLKARLAAAFDSSRKLVLYRLPGAGADKPAVVSSLPVPESESVVVTFAPSGDALVVSSLPPPGQQAWVEFWDLRDPVRPHRVRTVQLESIAFGVTADTSGAKIAFYGGSTVSLWSPGKGDELIRLPAAFKNPHGVTDLAMTPDGSLLAVGTTVGTQLWSIADNVPVLLQTLPGGETRLAISVHRPRLVIADNRGTALWDVTSMISAVTTSMADACRLSTGLSPNEWQRYAGNVPYQNTCT